jgi:predicted unusual protein kinase regulating ubiquinone biosynthesis (AarF/ABC1/UbiB family)
MNKWRFVVRALVIAAVVVWAAVRFLSGWLLLFLLWQDKGQRQQWFARCFVGLFRTLGPSFIKVGQIMSTRPDLFPPHIIAALETLQDDVGPFAYAHVQRIFVEDFGRPPAEVFAEISPLPIASASVAQVHKARLGDGRVVAVKVRRPKLDQIVTFDLGIMRGWRRCSVGCLPSGCSRRWKAS